MKTYLYYTYTLIITINSLFLLHSSKVDGVGSPLLRVNGLARSKQRQRSACSTTTANHIDSLCFTTLSRFEKEEEEAESQIWVDVEENEEIGHDDDYEEVYEDYNNKYNEDEEFRQRIYREIARNIEINSIN